MNLSQIQGVYFIGIGGIGMSALARYFKFVHKEVAGYDKTETPLTKDLEALGIAIHYHDDVAAISNRFKDPGKTLKGYLLLCCSGYPW